MILHTEEVTRRSDREVFKCGSPRRNDRAGHTGRWRDGGTRNGQAAPAVILYKTVTGHDDDAATAAARNESAAPRRPHPPPRTWSARARPSVPPRRRRTNRRCAGGASATVAPSTVSPPAPADAGLVDTTPAETWGPTAAGRQTPPPPPPPRCPVLCRGGGPCRSLAYA